MPQPVSGRSTFTSGVSNFFEFTDTTVFMKLLNHIPPIFLSLGLLVFPACSSKQDKIISVKPDDAEMNAAIARARASLPQFWEVFGNPAHGEKGFSLKVRITDKHGSEHFWLTDIERKDGQLHGIVNNDPDIVKNVKLGQLIAIPEADISDWMYMREGKMVGNYTLRVLFKSMPANEVKQYKAMMAEP